MPTNSLPPKSTVTPSNPANVMYETRPSFGTSQYRPFGSTTVFSPRASASSMKATGSNSAAHTRNADIDAAIVPIIVMRFICLF